MRLTDQAIERPLVVLLATVLVFLLGGYAMTTIPVERDPDVVIPFVVVTVPWPAATPEEIEREIARPLEQQLQGLDNVDFLHLNSVEGACSAVVRFLDGTDSKEAKREIKDRVDRARPDFPDDAEEPIIFDVRLDAVPVVLVTVAGGGDLITLEEIAAQVADEIETQPGVSDVELFGGLDRQVQVQCDPGRLAAFGLTFADVSDAIRQWNLNWPAGRAELATNDPGQTPPRDYAARVVGEITRPERLAELQLTSPMTGQTFPLSEVARVVPGFEDRESFARFNGESCVTCVVYRRGGVNTIELVERVKTVVADFETRLPEGAGIRLHTTQDIGREIRMMMGQLGSSALYGAGLVFVALMLAVGARNSLLVAFAIPFTVALSIFFLNVFGHTINGVTLFGMIVILGLVVDGAVIVGENIFRHVEEGLPPKEAARIGIHEVGKSVIIADITTICAFVPLVILSGSTGEYLSPIPVVVALALAASVTVDHFVLPAIAARVIPRKRQKPQQHTRVAPDDGGSGSARSRSKPETKPTGPRQPLLYRALRWLVFGADKPDTGTSGADDSSFSDEETVDAKRPGAAEIADAAASTSGAHQPPAAGSEEHEIDGLLIRKADQGPRAGGVRRFIAVGGERKARLTESHQLAKDGGAPIIRFMRAVYVKFLVGCMRVPILVFGVVTAAVVMGLMALFGGAVGFELMPHVDRGRFYVRLEMPVGTPLERTREALMELETVVTQFATEHPGEIVTWVSTGGQTDSLQSDIREQSENGPEFGKIQIELADVGERVRTQYEILTDLRARFPEIPGGKVIVEEIYEGPPAGKPVAIRLFADSYKELGAASAELLRILGNVRGTRDAESDYIPTRPQLTVHVREERARAMNTPTASAVAASSAALFGIEAGDIELHDENVEIRVLARPDLCDSPEELRALPVRTSAGPVIPLGEVADVMVDTGVRKLQRRDGRKCVAVRSDLQPDALLVDVLRDLRREVSQSDVLQRLGARFEDETGTAARVRMRFEGETKERDRTFNELVLAMGLGLVLVTFVLTAYLNSMIQTGILLLTVPLGFVGVLVGLMVTGNTFNTLSFMGIVAMTGIVVNDAVVLLDYTNYRRQLEPWRSVREIVLMAARTRLRPVLVTTVTTVGGLLPLALNWSGGGRFWEPLAWAIIFGVSFATVLTLVVIPVAYNFLLNPDEGVRRFAARIFGRRQLEGEPATLADGAPDPFGPGIGSGSGSGPGGSR